ncbi:MAG: Na(+)-translocating NADH-quinone reductase subunit A [Nitrospiraceae bacterium]|nr:MAG: Na(+)-translocating NADH-quinone reductase subunit A [Nitrospiraceae bacterium]
MEPLKIRIRKGLDLPIAGRPDEAVCDVKRSSTVALLGPDYRGAKPQPAVSLGDFVRLGEVLFRDRKNPAVQYTAPGSGEIIAINRGDRRALLSIVIALEGDDAVSFHSWPAEELAGLPRQDVMSLLLTSGLWTAIRARPFGRVADPQVSPHAMFVTAMDTNPLAPSIPLIIGERERDFGNGLKVLSRLTSGNLYLCTPPGAKIPAPALETLRIAEFAGPHPAGNAGTHIHFLDPAGRGQQAWHINAQDVIAIGVLFTEGRLDMGRVISLGGPSAMRPRMIRTRIGASTGDITHGELKEGEQRIISGSVLSGHRAHEETAYLGRYHQQVSVIPEDAGRSFLGWIRPGSDVFSLKNIVLSRFVPGKLFPFTSSAQGSRRAIVPIGSYEKVMPLDILATHLLRALEVDDIDEAERLGCLELDEEDLALCTVVCPSKIDHGAALRRNLALIEKEG